MNQRPGRLTAGIEAILMLAVMVLALAPGARARPNSGATTGAPRSPERDAPQAPHAAARQAAPVVPYDIVYVRQPRYGDSTNTTWPEVFHPARIDPGADLMLLHPDGSEERLVEGGEGSVTDPFVSFDGQWVYYSYFYAPGKVNTQRDLPFVGADIFRLHLPTRRVEKLTHGHDPARPTGPLPVGEFIPHTGTGKWFQSPDGAYQPNDVPAGYNRLGYGIFNLGPAELAGGRVIFSSNRAGMLPPKGYTNPSLQLYVMDQDGGNVTPIAPLTLSSALHPTPLADGRVMFSSHEAQGLRDQRLWGIWTIYPDGRYWEPLVSGFHDAQAFHFMTQVSSGDVVVVDYYNLNNNGFGALFRLPLAAPGGGPRYYPAALASNPPIDQTVSGGFPYPFRMPFTPKGFRAITPFTHPQDEASPLPKGGGPRVGKFTLPSAAPGGDLLVVWTGGPANDLDRPTTLPRYDAGLYLVRAADIDGGQALRGPDQLILLKNDPAYNEAWPRAVVPYRSVHGVDAPARLPWLPNDGALRPELPAGTPYGLIGTSGFGKRESFPGWGVKAYEGLDPFNTSENGPSSNWSTQGSDDGKYSSDDIWAVRLVALEGHGHRSYGPGEGVHFVNVANERMRVLGEIPLRKFGADGSPILDPTGAPDTSFLARIPADTPFTFQTLDRDGLVLNMAQTWHQLRPGEVRADCGGCHAHSQAPLAFEQTAAARPDYQVWDLVHDTPLIRRDAAGVLGVRRDPRSVVDVEFVRDVRPILQRSCVSCHTGASANPPGMLVLDDTAQYQGIKDLGLGQDYRGYPGDFARLARDPNAKWGFKPVIRNGSWRTGNASRYVRMLQSRRSLLMWKVLGRRLDGWSNADHPTESVPGDPATLPAGANANDADLDFDGLPCPPPGSGVPPLSDDDKRTLARWIDLGAPLDFDARYGWFADDQPPTLTVSQPRPELLAAPPDTIRFGVADANSGIDASSRSVTASFAVGGRAAGAELIDLAVEVADGVYAIPLAPPPAGTTEGRVTVRVRDRQGNETRVDRRFRMGGAGAEPTPTVAPSAPVATAVPTAVGTRGVARGRVYLPWLRRH
jgi:hypothetical protein